MISWRGRAGGSGPGQACPPAARLSPARARSCGGRSPRRRPPAFSASPSDEPAGFDGGPADSSPGRPARRWRARSCPARARSRRSQPRTVAAGTSSARRGAHHDGSKMQVRWQDRQRARRGRSRAVRPLRSRTARSRPYPHGASRRSRTTGTPVSRPPGQRPRHRHPGTAARRAGLPGRLGHEPSLPGTGRPGPGGTRVAACTPSPGPQPESPMPPQTGTMTTRRARCQPRPEPGTLTATVTPSTSTPHRRTLWNCQMPLPQRSGRHAARFTGRR